MSSAVPVTLVTGFLGSGKTTLLNRLLSDPQSPPTAVIVNEFGALGIDGRLVVGATEQVVELKNGCICCEVREDLRRTAVDLLARRSRWWRPQRFTRVVVETSGLAAPGPLIQTFLLDPTLAAQTTVDGVIALAHARHLVAQLADHPEAAAQLACADRILLNHVDEADPTDAEVALDALAPGVPVMRAVRAEVPVAPLLSIGGSDPARWRFAEGVSHSAGIVTQSFRTSTALDLGKLKMFLQFIAVRRGWEILRLKGIFRCVGMPNAVVAQGVYQWLELGPGTMPAPAESGFVVIGRALDVGEIQRGWAVISGT